jgi:hypothetical protein
MMIAHNVYFTLSDNSPAAVRAMVADCRRYLADMPGIVFYAGGTPYDADRASSDADFDASVHVVFENRAALDAYMAAPKHLELIEKYRHNWKDVRAFDSCLDQAK